MKTNIYLHRDKEENWDIIRKAEKKGYKNTDDLRYLGSEVQLQVEIDEECNVKILKINGTDISQKGIII